MRRFIKYTAVGMGTLSLDMLMLLVAVRFLGVWYPVAVMGAFFIAVSCNYAISRYWVFAGTVRAWWEGYVYFAFFAVFLAGLMAFVVAQLVEYFGLPYLLARLLAAGPIGLVNYLLNLKFNFMLGGKD